MTLAHIHTLTLPFFIIPEVHVPFVLDPERKVARRISTTPTHFFFFRTTALLTMHGGSGAIGNAGGGGGSALSRTAVDARLGAFLRD